MWSLPNYQLIVEHDKAEENLSFLSLDFQQYENETPANANTLILSGSLRDTNGPPGMDLIKTVRVMNAKGI